MPADRLQSFQAKPFETGPSGRRRGWVHEHGPALVQLFRLSDAACLAGSLWLAALWLGGPALVDREQLLVALLAVACFMIAANHWALYRSWRASSIVSELSRALACCVTAILLVVAALFASGTGPQLPRELLLPWGIIAFCTLAGGRLAVRLGLRGLRARGSNFRTAAIVGATDIGQHVAAQLRLNPWMGIRLLGIFDPGNQARGCATEGLGGSLEDLKRHIAAGQVDIVYIALPLRVQRVIQHVVDQLRDSTVSVLFVADFSVYGLLHARWEMLGGMPTVSLIDTPHQDLDGMLKRVMDIALASVALVVLALPMIAVAVAIKLSSPGPVAFVQKRYGLDGKEFDIYKFRTMTVVEDGKSEFTQARKGDVRVFRVGAFLRRTSLDELPQLLNVLQGQMSLVGPRPHPVALNESQRKLIDGYMLRHKVRPGITGWAQVHGCRGETDTPEKMENRLRYDLEYINDWSLWLDIQIMWKTLFTVLRDSNAY